MCKVSFATAMTKVPELELQKKKSPNELRKNGRARYRKVKSNIEDAWKTDSLERKVWTKNSICLHISNPMVQAYLTAQKGKGRGEGRK